MSLHVDSCSDSSDPEDEFTRIAEPGYRKGTKNGRNNNLWE